MPSLDRPGAALDFQPPRVPVETVMDDVVQSGEPTSRCPPTPRLPTAASLDEAFPRQESACSHGRASSWSMLASRVHFTSFDATARVRSIGLDIAQPWALIRERL